MSIVDWIYPKRCVGCGEEGRYICEKCRGGIMRVDQSLRYTGAVRKVLKEIKYRGTYDMVRELVEVWRPERKEEFEDAVVTAVPMWKGKKRERGYNQAELIAREIARRWGLEYRDLLVRTRQTLPMYGLDRNNRLENVRGAFDIRTNNQIPITKQMVILIDDVWTTGATMRECVKVLKGNGWEKVWMTVVAR